MTQPTQNLRMNCAENGSTKYPVAGPVMGELEAEYVSQAVASGWVSSIGPFIDSFERQFAAFVGAGEGIAVANGTVALHLALHALGVGASDEVIVPDLTFVATAHAVLMAGATPVFVDAEPSTWCLSPQAVLRALTSRTKAVIAVHLYGHPADMCALRKICTEHGIALVEDAAEALGASIGGVRVGALGDIATFSFYGNKTITTGEGGMVTTNDCALASRVRLLKDHGMHKNRRYYHEELAFNYRMTNVQAALGLAQLTRLSGFLERKKRIYGRYLACLRSCGMALNPTTASVDNSFWMSCMLLSSGGQQARDLLAVRLARCGIETRPFFLSMSALPHLAGYRRVGSNGDDCPVARHLSEVGLCLPSGCGLTDEDVDAIGATVADELRILPIILSSSTVPYCPEISG